MEFTVYNGDATVKLDITEEKKQQIVDRIITYMKTNDCYSGEVLHQSDDCLIEAPTTLSDIIDDIIKPDMEWKD